MNRLWDLLGLTVLVVALGILTRPGSQGPTLVTAATSGWSSVLGAVSQSGNG